MESNLGKEKREKGKHWTVKGVGVDWRSAWGDRMFKASGAKRNVVVRKD